MTTTATTDHEILTTKAKEKDWQFEEGSTPSRFFAVYDFSVVSTFLPVKKDKYSEAIY